MYHIKSDKRSQASADAIVQGLRDCLKTMPLSAVTVSDIHRASGISRATFYRLFDTPDDVWRYYFQQMLQQREWDGVRPVTSAQWMETVIAKGMEHHELIKTLLDNRRLDLLYEYTEKSFRQIDSHFSLFPGGMSPVEREYVLSHMAMSMVSTLIVWEKNGCRETAAELAEYLQRYIRALSSIVER